MSARSRRRHRRTSRKRNPFLLTLIVLVLMFSTSTTNSAGDVTLASPYNVIALIAANAYVFSFGLSPAM